MSATPRLTLPFLSPGQAQKEFFHNEALQVLDILIAAAVEEGPRDDPPSSPSAGDCYIVGEDPTACGPESHIIWQPIQAAAGGSSRPSMVFAPM